MANSLHGWVAIFVSLCAALGCNAVPEQGLAKRSEALTPGPSFTLQLPPQLTSGGSGLTVSTTLTLADRVQVKQPTGGAFAGIVNLGSGLTVIGKDDKTGDVWSVGSALSAVAPTPRLAGRSSNRNPFLRRHSLP
jgi:hypothetical protein